MATADSLYDPNMPTPPPPTAPAASATGAPTLTDAQQATALSSACAAWVADTGIVSNFLNIGAGLVNDTSEFENQANIALQAEDDELLHKAAIDQLIGNDPTISLANLTLTDGSFQSVVNGLADMALNGPSRAADIPSIDTVRCPQILPAIDAYCAIAAEFAAPLGVMFSLRAIRPSACSTVTGSTLSFSTNAPMTTLPTASNGGKYHNGTLATRTTSAGSSSSSSVNGGSGSGGTSMTYTGPHSNKASTLRSSLVNFLWLPAVVMLF
jgi:hypothetical protein